MNRKVFFGGTLVLVISALAGFFLYQYQSRQMQAGPAVALPAPARTQAFVSGLVGQAGPEFTLPDLMGNQKSIKEWNGKVVAINFWATWCPPCLKEIPELIALQEAYGDRGFSVVGIALQNAEEVTDFVRDKGINYPVLAGEMPVIKIAEAYGNSIGALPYTVILDRQGTISYIKAGQVSREDVESAITPLL